jgi:uncharacterized protein (DUF433 family)
MIAIHSEMPPLRADESGAIRVGASRVLLEIVIRAFQDGATPEAIAQRYPTASLSDLYSVIGYYLHHTAEVDQYLADREQLATDVRQEVDAFQGDLAELRQRILARRPS